MVRPFKKNEDRIVYKYCVSVWFSFNKIVLLSFHINTYREFINYYRVSQYNHTISYPSTALPCWCRFWLSFSLPPPSLPSFHLSSIHFCCYKQCCNDHPILQTPAWELPFVHCCLWVKSQVDSYKSVVWVSLETGSPVSPTGDIVGSILGWYRYLIRLTPLRFVIRKQPRLIEHWAKLSCIQLWGF